MEMKKNEQKTISPVPNRGAAMLRLIRLTKMKMQNAKKRIVETREIYEPRKPLIEEKLSKILPAIGKPPRSEAPPYVIITHEINLVIANALLNHLKKLETDHSSAVSEVGKITGRIESYNKILAANVKAGVWTDASTEGKKGD